MATRQYPNTAQGALQCLRDESSYDKADLDVAKVQEDQHALGTWCVDLPHKVRVIVYLKGWGRYSKSEYNDFEEGFRHDE